MKDAKHSVNTMRIIQMYPGIPENEVICPGCGRTMHEIRHAKIKPSGQEHTVTKGTLTFKHYIGDYTDANSFHPDMFNKCRIDADQLKAIAFTMQLERYEKRTIG